ncbi:MAG: 4Fe-4S ferredoxin [Deltaproteobacteria bacterium CG07_land_8_20_14_0_80_60_11]|nr:MAG: 4Fe-4S ferredoxin [Deltaproteobacteria bacterium CG07_land_8_20_14_0_80_60_11]
MAKESARGKGNVGSVMVVGGGVAGMQASLDLANSGFYVHLVETKPAIGGVMAQLDKTFPTNDCSMCIISPKLVECGRHLNIEIHTLTDVAAIDGEPGNLKVTLKKQPRYVDPAKCTGCGECANVCPVTISDAFNAGLADWKAVYRLYPQAIPAAFGIKKLDRAPCTLTCPAEINVQGYVQLIKLGKYEAAVKLIMERLPLPGVLGRICPHPCEAKCRRGELDEPVAICNLKRFAADQVDLGAISPPLVEARSDRVAIIGSGPAGLACAYHLALKGYRPTIFEALPKAGGMLRVGIPDYRLPKDILDREIDHILRLGVELKTNTALGRDFTLDGLFDQGYKSVFLGIGCHVGKPLGIPGEEAEGVIQGVEFLRRANLKEPLTVGKRLAVIGGGNVAIDVACTARRLGSEVTIVYRRSREEMPAFAHEVEQATCEGVEIVFLAAPLKAVTGKDGSVVRVNGLICQKMELGEPDASGRRRPVPIEGAEFELPVDMIVPAIGQEAAQGPLAACGVKLSRRGTIEVNEVTYETSRAGVFAAGDVHTGPWIAIEAVGGGIEAAASIDRYLRGVDMVEGRSEGEEAHKRWAEIPKDEEGAPREVMAALPPEHTCTCFDEISQGYTEEQAQREAARCLNCGVCSECMQCVAACQAGAIDHSMKAETKEVKVGAVILSPGFQTFSPVKCETYHYATLPNVVTSLEFERILSASGPFGGHLVRPSDHQEPKKIAWLQCVGSRDVKYHTYCSSVCCMYAIKEAMIAKEHAPYPLDTAIFFMDMRTFGKDFELYYNRAKDEHGVRFIRSRIHSIDPLPDGDLQIRYADESGADKTDAFNMIVLSVAMEVSQPARELAQTLGVGTNAHDFVATSPFAPVSADRSGIYVCGAMQGPKDIPESVMQASAAAGAVSASLGDVRWTETKTRQAPTPKDIKPEDEPRIGVFVCNCGINIGGIVNIPELRKYAATLPNVVHVEDNLFTCSQDTQVQMTRVIEEQNLNRVVVAACTPITHEPLFRETLIDAGLNKYLFEMANIRNQDSWVHMKEHDKATDKAKDLVRMAVARASLLKPLLEKPLSINQRALVIGGGIAGLNAALNLGDQGFETILLEKEPQLGGTGRRVHKTIEGLDVQAYLDGLIERVKAHDKIQVLTGALVVRFSGYKGNFTTEVLVGPGMYERKIDHGIAVVATGAHEYHPKEFLYGEHERVMTQLELGDFLHKTPATAAKWDRVVMVQCVGSRNEENPNCSRICCQGAVKYALQLKDLNPDMDVVILYRDIRTYGFLEDYYREARDKGVLFSRFEPDRLPQVTSDNGQLSVTFVDHVLGRPINMAVDAVVLSAGARANDTEELASLLKIPRNAGGFFIEAHAKLRPVDFASEGIFLCGMAHSPKLINESIAQAMAAAARAGAFLADVNQTISGVTAHVDPDRCAACLVCVRTCPYGVPQINRDNVSEINEALCQGCGTCASECPAKVIQVAHYEDDQISAKIKTLY